MAQEREQADVRIGPQGRIVIPAPLRRALGLKPGDKMLARVEGETLVLERRRQVLHRLRSRFSGVPSDVSLVEELIADRRAEAAADAED